MPAPDDTSRRPQKLAPGSTLRLDDQERLYAEQVGAAALERQKRAAESERKHRGRMLKSVS